MANDNFEKIVKFYEVPVGTIIKGAGEFYKTSKSRSNLIFEQKNGFLWRKMDSQRAHLVTFSGDGNPVDVTADMLNGQMPDTYYDSTKLLSGVEIERRRENSRKNWRHPMGRTPDLVAKFGPQYIVGIVAVAPQSR